MASATAAHITVVTVSYGRRVGLVRQVLASLPAQGVDRAIVVDNGSLDDLETLRDEFPDWVEVVRLNRNTGSAGGFKAGMQRALATGSEFIWLLDDDNVPQEGALQALRQAFPELEGEPAESCALLSYRPEHQADIAAGVPLRRCYPRPGSFFCFHLLDLPYKLWRRTGWGKPRQVEALPERILLPYAPYSGLFFHSSLIQRIGLPEEELVLYADDTQFTARLTDSGGRIYLVPGSRLRDLELSWNTKSQFGSSALGWICGSSDFRAFYGARNLAYVEACRQGSGMVRSLNKWAYLLILVLAALWKGKLSRFALLLDAIRRGEAGSLGMDRRFSLR